MEDDSDRIRFRAIRRDDRERLLSIAARVWEGHDYLPAVFDRWIAEPGSYFGGMELDGRLVGCGRVMRFDERRGWLEGLRVDPDLHQQGLGRRMSGHVMRTAVELGLTELMFSTYFDNRASVTIGEGFGFRRMATFTHLERERPAEPEAPRSAPEMKTVRLRAGLPRVSGFAANDWLFVPADVPDLARHFPNARTVTDGTTTLMLCDNVKYPGWLEIGWLHASGGAVSGACLDVVLEAARAEAREGIHLMLPAGLPLAPFRERGFTVFEQEGDVYLYGARTEALRL